MASPNTQPPSCHPSPGCLVRSSVYSPHQYHLLLIAGLAAVLETYELHMWWTKSGMEYDLESRKRWDMYHSDWNIPHHNQGWDKCMNCVEYISVIEDIHRLSLQQNQPWGGRICTILPSSILHGYWLLPTVCRLEKYVSKHFITDNLFYLIMKKC